jgi:hypothetical protein
MTTEDRPQSQQAPDLESELDEMKVEPLRAKARELDVPGAKDMHKGDLVKAVAKTLDDTGDSAGGKPVDGPVETPVDGPDRAAPCLVTTSPFVIRDWARRRGARPAPAEGDDGPRLVLPSGGPSGGGPSAGPGGGATADEAAPDEWDEWFAALDNCGLAFVYQEYRGNAAPSDYFRFEEVGRRPARTA